jgi:hypothetical protein
VRTANQQLQGKFPRQNGLAGRKDERTSILSNTVPCDHLTLRFAATHQGNYATILNYPVMELRYMDAGEEAQSAKAGP